MSLQLPPPPTGPRAVCTQRCTTINSCAGLLRV